MQEDLTICNCERCYAFRSFYDYKLDPKYSNFRTESHKKEVNMREGIYETTYGNAAYVNGNFAYDLDMGEVIPVFGFVTNKFIREAESSDIPMEALDDDEDFESDLL